MPGEGEGAGGAEDCSGFTESKDEKLINGLTDTAINNKMSVSQWDILADSASTVSSMTRPTFEWLKNNTPTFVSLGNSIATTDLAFHDYLYLNLKNSQVSEQTNGGGCCKGMLIEFL